LSLDTLFFVNAWIIYPVAKLSIAMEYISKSFGD